MMFMAKSGPDPDKLNPRQLKFVEAYNGNATEAARIAGYNGDDNTLGQTGFQLLNHPKISEAIKARQEKAIKKIIATREKRQQFWTQVMEDEGAELRDRLKASEILGKSEADFVERHELSGPDGKPIQLEASKLTDEQLQAKVQALLAKAKAET